jgi:hypothetical protein
MNETNVLEALERPSTGEGQGQDRAECCDEIEGTRAHGRTYQPLFKDSTFTIDPPRGLRAQNTKTDLTFRVGRLHCSLRPTLSAHFRWCIGAFRGLNFAS